MGTHTMAAASIFPMRRTIPPSLRTLRTAAAAIPTAATVTATTTTTTAAAASISTAAAIHHVPRYPSVFTRSLATEPLPFRERIRRKLWGTESPPGPEDPYQRRPEEPVIEDDDIDRSNYVAATDGRSLPIMGLDEPLGKWDVRSFIPATPVRETNAVILTLRRAVVEVLMLQLNGYLPGDVITGGRPVPDEPLWGGSSQEEVDIIVAENGEVQLVYPDANVEETILWRFRRTADRTFEQGGEKVEGVEKVGVEKEQAREAAPQDTAVPATETGEVGETGETAATAETAETAEARKEADMGALEANRKIWLADALSNRGWVTLPLRSVDTKFAIVKRVLQLTGQMVPDHITSQAKTVADLLQPLITPEKPKRLAEELAQNEELVSLPNVKLFDSRLRPYDKEKLLGRAIPREVSEYYVYEGIDESLKHKPWKGHVVYR